MKRTIWLALLGFCTACTAQPDGGQPEQTNGEPVGLVQPSDEVQPPGEAKAAAQTEPFDGARPSEAAEPPTGAPPSDVASDDEPPADDGKQPTATAPPPDDDAPTEVAQLTDEAATDAAVGDEAVAGTPAVIGLVTEKPAEGPSVETDRGYMVPYTVTIPGTDVHFEMVPIPGGTFTMGSPDSEENRGDDEGPQFQVEVAPFWMGKYEVTWAEYKNFMQLVDTFIDFKTYKMRVVTDENRCDAVTAPSNLYDPSVTFSHGEDPQQPAVTMTAYAAKQYTKWISKLTGQCYRLPTEAEWEYACRAGTTTAYYFGDSPGELGDHAWYADNSDEKTHHVGQKRPNPWGLYDMLGNVAELVLDEYREAYGASDGKPVAAADAVAWPNDYDNRVFRGGSWDDFEEDCRSAKRRATEGEDWKIEDPNEPKSPWWYADEPSLCVGFRMMRSLREPSEEELRKVWDAAVADVQDAADHRISEGRGAWGLVDPDLPSAVEDLKKKKASG
jgi:formylglycine-generating enzyme required for sulfatase activity